MKHYRRKILIGCMLFCLFFAGCQGQKTQAVVTGQFYHPSKQQSQETDFLEEEKDSRIGTDLYLIISNDMTMEQFVLRQLASGRQYIYQYSLSTSFWNKYGDAVSVTEFEPGRVICIGTKDSNQKLNEAKLSDEVWEYEGITKYTVDTERGIFQIADSKYSYGEDIFVESDGRELQIASLNGEDEIRVIGIGKQILSVSITTGHGTLALKNTKTFQGSYIQVGSKIFANITGDMELEIPEGDYTVTVANGGYGGSMDVTIERGTVCELDLEQLKGDGPKTATVVFYVNASDATMQIDGKEKDYTNPVELAYGIHSIFVTADGYKDYSKKLVVNSASGSIDIEMTKENSEKEDKESETQEEDETEDAENAQQIEDEIESTQQEEVKAEDTTQEEEQAEEEEKTSDEVVADYLSTLTDIVNSLTKTGN